MKKMTKKQILNYRLGLLRTNTGLNFDYSASGIPTRYKLVLVNPKSGGEKDISDSMTVGEFSRLLSAIGEVNYNISIKDTYNHDYKSV